MEVTLKKVKTFNGRESIGLNAEVYVNGEKCFYYIDQADGGISYQVPIYNKELYQQLKDYAASLPKEKVDDFELQPDIDTLVNKAFEAYELDKSDKKMMKKTDGQIVFSSGKGEYAYAKWGNLGLQKVIESWPEKVKEKIVSMRNKYPGWKLLNTNIPAELLN
jgi:hypothetical protein